MTRKKKSPLSEWTLDDAKRYGVDVRAVQKQMKAQSAEIVAELTKLHGEGVGHDYEAYHRKGDLLICALLIGLGYEDVVGAWDKIPKYYS